MKILCAWCGKDMGEKAPEEPGISHGICERCKKLFGVQPPQVRYSQEKIEQIMGKVREIKEIIYEAMQTLARPSIYHDLLAMAHELSTLVSEGETIREVPTETRSSTMIENPDKPAPEKMTWISIQARMPTATRFLHVLRSGNKRDVAVLFEEYEWLDSNLDVIDDVTHWREGGNPPHLYQVLGQKQKRIADAIE